MVESDSDSISAVGSTTTGNPDPLILRKIVVDTLRERILMPQTVEIGGAEGLHLYVTQKINEGAISQEVGEHIIRYCQLLETAAHSTGVRIANLAYALEIFNGDLPIQHQQLHAGVQVDCIDLKHPRLLEHAKRNLPQSL